MNTLLEVFVALSWLFSLGLDIAGAGYCYRITRITGGGFKAWWLMIAFAAFFAVSSFFSVSYSVLSSASFGNVMPAITSVAFIDVGLNLLLSVLFFCSMVGLFITFNRQLNPPSQITSVPTGIGGGGRYAKRSEE